MKHTTKLLISIVMLAFVFTILPISTQFVEAKPPVPEGCPNTYLPLCILIPIGCPGSTLSSPPSPSFDPSTCPFEDSAGGTGGNPPDSSEPERGGATGRFTCTDAN